MTRRIVCVGSVVQDEVYRMERLPTAGIKMDAYAVEDRFGGPAETAAVAIAKLGGRPSFWGRVGRDPAGDACIAALAASGVDGRGIAIIDGARTRRAVVMVDRSGERCIVTYRQGLPDDPHYLPNDPLDGVAVVLGDSRWPLGSIAAIECAHTKGIATVVDVDGGDRKLMQRLVGLADHVIFSAEGLRDFAGEGDPAGQLMSIVPRPGQVLAVTRGAEGSVWRLCDAIVTVGAFKVDVADTTGCGDIFHGAYAFAIAEGMAPIAAARFASAASALKAERGRGWLGMPDRSAVDAMLAP